MYFAWVLVLGFGLMLWLLSVDVLYFGFKGFVICCFHRVLLSSTDSFRVI